MHRVGRDEITCVHDKDLDSYTGESCGSVEGLAPR